MGIDTDDHLDFEGSMDCVAEVLDQLESMEDAREVLAQALILEIASALIAHYMMLLERLLTYELDRQKIAPSTAEKFQLLTRTALNVRTQLRRA